MNSFAVMKSLPGSKLPCLSKAGWNEKSIQRHDGFLPLEHIHFLLISYQHGYAL